MTLKQLKKKYGEEPKKRGGVRMPRFFKFTVFTILVLILWKIYANLEVIVGFVANHLVK